MQSVKAEVCHTHYIYGHQTRLGHIRLGAQDRLQIAGKLAQGVTLDKLLDDVRSSVSDNFKRVHLLQRKDTHNIERIFKLEGGQRHHDDATSAAEWVEEMREKGEGNVVENRDWQLNQHNTVVLLYTVFTGYASRLELTPY